MIDDINQRTMRSREAVEHYSDVSELTAPERASLHAVAALARGKPILDIGVGVGRTVKPLLEVSADYLGVDNSPEMIAACKARFPGVRLEFADARRMDGVADAAIFLAMFSCNGIGMVSHQDRLLILREVFRVLQPGGVFLFSSHNRNCPDHVAGFKLPSFAWSANPARLAVRGLRFAGATAIRVFNRSRFVKHEVRESNYSIINDVCHNYGTMLYYISVADQRRQLEDVGFERSADAYDESGRLVTTEPLDSSIAYVARKPI